MVWSWDGMTVRCQKVWRWLVLASVVFAGPVQSHGVTVGRLQIDHPYALPTEPGQTEGMVYFRFLRNEGTQEDRLVAAQTPRAQQVRLQRLSVHGEAQQPVPVTIVLPARSAHAWRHDQAAPLVLQGLKRPLVLGERFVLTLHFAHAGPQEVVVWVQQPRQFKSSSHTH